MRSTLAAIAVLLLVAAPAASASDAREVRWFLQDVGASRIYRIACDEQRHCTARYAYVDKAAFRVGLRHVAFDRCRAEFVVSDGVDDLGGGYEFDYTEVTQSNERCGSRAGRHSRTGYR